MPRKPTGTDDGGVAVSAAATIAAHTLRERILDIEPGSFLGSEDDLMAQLGLSRATFRQTARVLEQQGLLVVRRGAAGGYYSRLPDFRNVVDAAVLFLRAQRTTLEETTNAAHSFSVEVSRRAAESTDRAARGAFARIVQDMRNAAPEDMSNAEFMASEVEFTDALFLLVASTPLYLIMKIFYHFAAEQFDTTLFTRRPNRRLKWRRARLELANAIIARDAVEAVRITEMLNAMSTDWLKRDARRARTAKPAATG
jgi:DNA-binding FadR family transcriptional regulator